MNEQEISNLKTEIARLNQIIDVLLKHNGLLERENANLKTSDASGTSGYSIEKSGDGIGTRSYAIDNIEDGITDNSYSIAKTVDGIGTSGYSIVKSVGGTGTRSYSTHKTGDGITGGSAPLPETISLNGPNVSKLATTLRSNGYTNVTAATLGNAAKLLIYFYNKGGGDHPEVRRVTGLSKGGNAKFISSLKKRGLINRTAYQCFEPSAQALGLMQKAFA